MAGCAPRDIYNALIDAGATAVQAIGIMANMIAESALDAEAAAMDTNGHMSYGLVQWNTASYPNAASLVTGNCAADIKAQVNFLAQTGGFSAALPSGSGTAGQAAAGFATGYERCQTCVPGGASYDQRVANAATVASWAASGKWPASAGTAAKTAAGTGGSTATGAKTCLIGPLPHTSWCLLTRSEGRAVMGASLLVAGALLALPGLLMLAAFAFRTTPRPVGEGAAVLERTPGYGHAIRAARTRSENRAARAQGARTEQLRQQRAAGRKQQRAAAP